MLEWIPGLVLGVGLVLLVGGDARSRLVRRVTPHLRDIAPARTSDEDINPIGRVVVTLFRAGPLVRSHRVRRARRAVDDEISAVLDMFGMCVAAGMSVPTACERIGRSGSGILAGECRRITAELELGVSVTDALRASDERVRHDGWTRFVEHLVSARRQGTPLADIVRFLADDEAQAEGRRLIESASTRETLMMFPLVFGILPATVLVAVFPGITAIGVLM